MKRYAAATSTIRYHSDQSVLLSTATSGYDNATPPTQPPCHKGTRRDGKESRAKQVPAAGNSLSYVDRLTASTSLAHKLSDRRHPGNDYDDHTQINITFDSHIDFSLRVQQGVIIVIRSVVILFS